MKAEILTVGSELLSPGRIDSNAVYLTERLAEVGIPVVFRATVGDEAEMIRTAVLQALERADLVLITGGLGPTSDDLTRDGVSRALGVSLHLDQEILDRIRRRFARRGVAMPSVNRRQAMVPEGAEVLPNPRGTAPGLLLRAGGDKRVVLLPGPPRELHGVFEAEVLPRLSQREGTLLYRSRRLLIAGLPESSVEERVGNIYRRFTNPRSTILAGAGQVEIQLVAHGSRADEAEIALESLASALREALGLHLFSESGTPLEEVVGHLLVESGQRLSVAESCTGGLLAHRITEVAGSSRYFERGFVTYSNESKTELLGVPEGALRAHGAVSEPVARLMALGARERARVDLAVAVTGIAGPGGGTPEKPVGLVFIAYADARGAIVRRFHLPGDRSSFKWWASQLALDTVRLSLLGGLDGPGEPSEPPEPAERGGPEVDP